ncbi:MAG: two pore domain potassium channel family protein [Actinobacteria bacterium]|nr:two pore domain potassium channel family protein [Actinomycetota bacterium]
MAIKIRPRRVVRVRSRGQWDRVQLALVLLVAVVVVGVVGYRAVGLSTFDALYQTAITVTTVGYGEIGPVEEIDQAYRWFTLF